MNPEPGQDLDMGSDWQFSGTGPASGPFIGRDPSQNFPERNCAPAIFGTGQICGTSNIFGGTSQGTILGGANPTSRIFGAPGPAPGPGNVFGTTNPPTFGTGENMFGHVNPAPGPGAGMVGMQNPAPVTGNIVGTGGLFGQGNRGGSGLRMTLRSPSV